MRTPMRGKTPSLPDLRSTPRPCGTWWISAAQDGERRRRRPEGRQRSGTVLPEEMQTGRTRRPWQGRKKWSAPARMPNRSGRRPDGSVERTGCGGSRSTTAAWSTTRRGISRGPGPGAGPWRTWRQPERTCSAISQRNRRIWSAHTTGRRSPGTRRSSSACTMN